MSNGSVLPPDIREQMENRRRAAGDGSGGIGAAAPGNAVTARQREMAINPDAALQQAVDEAEAATSGAEPEKEEAQEVCGNARCGAKLKTAWNFCAKCGQDLLKGSPAEQLGITFTEEDMSSYLFKGYVVRDLPLLGQHKVTVKSSQPKDMNDIDDYVMNGDWNKAKGGEERGVSEFYMRQMNSLCITAASVQKFDGTSIGETMTERIDWLNEKGSAFVDMVSQRAVWFNQALTDYLRDEDTIRGS